MSWSINIIGKPENVVAELERESEKLTGQCKIEFDDAKPHLIGLLRQNFAKEAGYNPPLMKVSASGSGSARNGEQLQRSLNATIEYFYSKLV